MANKPTGTQDSPMQRAQERENEARKGGQDRVPGIDKQLNGPNRPAE